jgi:hypothetical protein
MAGLASPGVASAQSGHLLAGGGNAPSCNDEGWWVACEGTVVGLGGTTFEITIAAAGIASVQCTNPGGEVAPGVDTAVNLAGATSALPTPRNRRFRFSVESVIPNPRDLVQRGACPNPMWTARILDVAFTEATLTLFEDGVQSDQVIVPVT